MGCEISNQQNTEIFSIQSEQRFKLSYRDLISQDRGHVFELYHFSTIISRSNYSIVRKVVTRSSKQSRVCKIVPLINKKYIGVISEVQYLKKIDHPNVVQIIEYFLEPSFLYIIFEEIPGKQVLSELARVEEEVHFNIIAEIMKQVLFVVEHCHCKMIAHRAITHENVLLVWNNAKPIVKLVDFSQAAPIDCPQPIKILKSKRNIIFEEEEIKKLDKLDIFDCGILFFTIILGEHPKNIQKYEKNFDKLFKDVEQGIKKLGISNCVSSKLLNLLKLMLSENALERPSASQCLKHQFFSMFQKERASSKKVISSLFQFKSDNNLKYLLQMYASLNMTSAIDKAEYLTEFYSLDTNKDGVIQLQELIVGIMNTFALDKEEAKVRAEEMFEHLDKNRSGNLSFSEYVIGTMKLSKVFSQQSLESMFAEIDLNKDGYITEQEMDSMIVGIDRHRLMNKKKEISYTEFKQIMLKMLEGEMEI